MTETKAALLIIGNEILSGRTVDANLAYLAQALNSVGIRLAEARVITDNTAEIVSHVNALRARYDYVVTTGGIGPTHDDITAASVAQAFNVPLLQHPEALARLTRHYAETGLELTAARLRMANAPQGATLIDNPISSAPGFQIENVLVLAGVPKIMQAMIDDVKGRLHGGEPMLSRSVACDLGEGVIAAGLEAIQLNFSDVEVGSYPRFGGAGGYRVAIVVRHTDENRLAAATLAVTQLIEALGGRPRTG